MKPAPIVIQLASPVPVMTYKAFAEHVGMSVRWVEEQVADGVIPTMPKRDGKKPLINLAKYWEIALTQPY